MEVLTSSSEPQSPEIIKIFPEMKIKTVSVIFGVFQAPFKPPCSESRREQSRLDLLPLGFWHGPCSNLVNTHPKGPTVLVVFNSGMSSHLLLLLSFNNILTPFLMNVFRDRAWMQLPPGGQGSRMPPAGWLSHELL